MRTPPYQLLRIGFVLFLFIMVFSLVLSVILVPSWEAWVERVAQDTDESLSQVLGRAEQGTTELLTGAVGSNL
ncbi:MAG: hypothetical protein M0Q54_10585 [Pigmentiphaga sp.]|nr:hypothetical protein [Pigmentiphaga sp.]